MKAKIVGIMVPKIIKKNNNNSYDENDKNGY